MKCRVCQGELREVFTLGEIYPSTFVKEQPSSGKFPLDVGECSTCGLVQLLSSPDLDTMYKEQYWYKSSLNSSMVNELREIYLSARSLVAIKPNDVVIDIGCNDGTLLGFYPEYLFRIGYDPAPNLIRQAQKNCDVFINNYFTKSTIKAKIITAIAMFYDLPDPNKFVEDVRDSLDEDGVFIVQFTDLYSMFRLNEFTSICHEHLEYYKITDIVKLMQLHGLEVFDAEYNAVNGGSLRVYVAHSGVKEVAPRLEMLLRREVTFFQENTIDDFRMAVAEQKEKLLHLLTSLKKQGKKVIALGASTKANTLLQHYGITTDLIPLIGDVNPDKFGLYTVGTNIPIVSEEEALAADPDFIVVLIWQFRNFFLEKFKGKKKLIFVLPEVEVV